MIKRKKQKCIYNSIFPINSPDIKPQFRSLTYFGPISEQIGNILSKLNFNISFKSQTKLSHLLFNNKDKLPKYKKPGVYKLMCPECDSFYVGQTGRSFEIRFKEHLRSFKYKKTDSTFANHFLETGHSFPDLNDISILHYQEKGFKLNVLESIEIYKGIENHKSIILNDQLDLFKTYLFNIFKNSRNKHLF
jgi:hypothetical protein